MEYQTKPLCNIQNDCIPVGFQVLGVLHAGSLRLCNGTISAVNKMLELSGLVAAE